MDVFGKDQMLLSKWIISALLAMLTSNDKAWFSIAQTVPGENSTDVGSSTTTTPSLSTQMALTTSTVTTTSVSQETSTVPTTTTETPSARESDTDTRIIHRGVRFESTRTNQGPKGVLKPSQTKVSPTEKKTAAAWKFGRGGNQESWPERTLSNAYPSWKNNGKNATGRESRAGSASKGQSGKNSAKSNEPAYLVWSVSQGQGANAWQVGNTEGTESWPASGWPADANNAGWNANQGQWAVAPTAGESWPSGPNNQKGASGWQNANAGASVGWEDEGGEEEKEDSEGWQPEGNNGANVEEESWPEAPADGAWPGGATNVENGWPEPNAGGNTGGWDYDTNSGESCEENCDQGWNDENANEEEGWDDGNPPPDANSGPWNTGEAVKGGNAGWSNSGASNAWQPTNSGGDVQWKVYNEDTQTMEDIEGSSGWKVIGDGVKEGWKVVDQQGNVEWTIENVNGEWKVSSADKIKTQNNSTPAPIVETTKSTEGSESTTTTETPNTNVTSAPIMANNTGWDDEKGGKYVVWKFSEDGKGEARFYGGKGEPEVWTIGDNSWWPASSAGNAKGPWQGNNAGTTSTQKGGNAGWNNGATSSWSNAGSNNKGWTPSGGLGGQTKGRGGRKNSGKISTSNPWQGGVSQNKGWPSGNTKGGWSNSGQAPVKGGRGGGWVSSSNIRGSGGSWPSQSGGVKKKGRGGGGNRKQTSRPAPSGSQAGGSPGPWQRKQSRSRGKNSNRSWQDVANQAINAWANNRPASNGDDWQDIGNTNAAGWPEQGDQMPYIIIIKSPTPNRVNANNRKRGPSSWSRNRGTKGVKSGSNSKTKGSRNYNAWRNRATGRSGWQWNPNSGKGELQWRDGWMGSGGGFGGWISDKGAIYSAWTPTDSEKQRSKKPRTKAQGSKKSASKTVFVFAPRAAKASSKSNATSTASPTDSKNMKGKPVIIIDYTNGNKSALKNKASMKSEITSVLKALKSAKLSKKTT